MVKKKRKQRGDTMQDVEQTMQTAAETEAADPTVEAQEAEVVESEEAQQQPGETSDAALPGQAVIAARVEHVITTMRTLRADEFAILDDGGLAFDHAKQIVYAILRLRNKIEYTDLALNLMPELFTLTDLQKVYEVILGRELLKAGFRRTVKDLVVETDEQTSSAGHRPSKLYRRNWNISLS